MASGLRLDAGWPVTGYLGQARNRRKTRPENNGTCKLLTNSSPQLGHFGGFLGLVRTGKATRPHGHTYVSGSLHINETELGARSDDVCLALPNMRGTCYTTYAYD